MVSGAPEHNDVFEGIENVNWIKYTPRIPCMGTPHSPMAIPELLNSLLHTDSVIRKAALDDLFRIIICKDQLSYFTEPALPTIPYLMEVFASDNFQEYGQFLSGLSGGLMNYQPNDQTFAKDDQHIFESVLETIHPYLHMFFPFLTSEESTVRRDVFGILRCFTDDINPVLTELLESGHRILQRDQMPHPEFFDDIRFFLHHSQPKDDQIASFVYLVCKALILRLRKPDSALSVYGSDPKYLVRMLEDYYSQIRHNHINRYLHKQFEIQKYSIKSLDQNRFNVFLVSLNLVASNHLTLDTVLPEIISVMDSASIRRQRILLKFITVMLGENDVMVIRKSLKEALKLPPEITRVVDTMRPDQNSDLYTKMRLLADYEAESASENA